MIEQYDDHEDINNISEDEVEPGSHNKLLDAVSQLYKKQRIDVPRRSEPNHQISEFNLSGQTGKDVDVRKLLSVLNKRATHKEVKDKLKSSAWKAKTLPRPLEKLQADKIKRQVGYSSVKKQLGKWDAIVQRNRAAEQLEFPLQKGETEIKFTDELTPFKNKSELEIKMMEILKSSQIAQEEKEEREEFPLSLEELIEKRKTAAKMRARESYRIAKAVRQNKIKSKKYHRILKREKIKQELKDFEMLQKTDPEAALEKLESIERARAEERISLRHRNTGKWARSLAIRAKYDVEARAQLAEQLIKSRELTKKIKTGESSSDEDTEEVIKEIMDTGSKSSNPWVKNNELNDFVDGFNKFCKNVESENKARETVLKDKENKGDNDSENDNVEEISENGETVEEIGENGRNVGEISENGETVEENGENDGKVDEISDNGKDQEDVTNLSDENSTASEDEIPKLVPIIEKIKSKVGTWEVSETDNGVEKPDWSLDEIFDVSSDITIKPQVNKAIKVKKVVESKKTRDKSYKDLSMKPKRVTVDDTLIEVADEEGISSGKNDIQAILDTAKTKTVTNYPEIDPKKFLTVKQKSLNTVIPDLEEQGDSDQETHLNLVEAFADDDILDEFRKEKQDEIDKSKATEIDLSMPGWGHWAGCSMPTRTKRKSRRIIVRFPEIARKDANKDLVIINDDPNLKIKEHMVNDLPYPFTSVEDYEASIRAPIGSTWVPQIAHKRYIAPPIITKMGSIIEPMHEDQLVKKKKFSKKLRIKN